MNAAPPRLAAALDSLHKAGDWVHLGTVGAGSEPHVSPVLMGSGDLCLHFSITGAVKKRNLRRDPRACVSVARQGDLAHVIVWGEMSLAWDERAQELWERLMVQAFGPDALDTRARRLDPGTTVLGVLHPTRFRIYGLG
jgi:nitroimidazol reductase NimA-like FMN-containing flavoprotein (pyridoxamine 5'-phosphate oxidase superfamily)